MPDLNFQIQSVKAVPHAVAPLLAFELRIAEAGDVTPIHSIALHCQIRIEPARRRYSPREQEGLFELFGPPADWGRTLRPMLWTHADAVIPGFSNSGSSELHVPCTFDFNVAATRFFQALDDGEMPLCFLFSGTIFYTDQRGALQAAPIPWDKEANFRLPVRTWREMMDLYYPNTAWLCLRRDIVDRLMEYKRAAGIATTEQAMESLLESVAAEVRR